MTWTVRCGWRPDGATQSLDVLGVALAEVRYRIEIPEIDGGR